VYKRVQLQLNFICTKHLDTYQLSVINDIKYMKNLFLYNKIINLKKIVVGYSL
jgi:hypothetical protein